MEEISDHEILGSDSSEEISEIGLMEDASDDEWVYFDLYELKFIYF